MNPEPCVVTDNIEQSPEQNFELFEAAISSLDINNSNSGWFLDSGVTQHVIGDRHSFSTLDEFSGNVRTAGGKSHQITGKGSVHFTLPSGKIKKVDEILYVPSFNKNLLSIGSLTDKGIVACFDDKKCILYSRGNKQIIAEGLRNKQNGLYHLSAIKTDVSVNIAQIDVESARFWHHRLGHISYDRLHELSAKGLATGLPYIPIHREICDQCQTGKQTRESFPHQSLSRASHPLQLLHVDLCSPLPVTSLGG